MKLLDHISVYSNNKEKRIELCSGDLTALNPDEAVDVLVVSAFPGDYTPTPSSLIGALSRKGVSVSALAMNKAWDLRQNFSCWMSHNIISDDPGIRFRRILCFEPLVKGSPPEVVGDIFRALAPFVGEENSISSVAMPIVAAGDQMVPISHILPPLIDASVHWMSAGLPLNCLKIVSHTGSEEAQKIFSEIKKKLKNNKYPTVSAEPEKFYKHDVFISYAHRDDDEALYIVKEIETAYPDIQIFFDKRNLKTGCSWQYEIFEALDDCQKVLALLSPSYVSSKVCKEEFNIAWFRSREEEKELLFAIYLYSAELPTYMKLCQYEDCREANKKLLRNAISKLIFSIKSG